MLLNHIWSVPLCCIVNLELPGAAGEPEAGRFGISGVRCETAGRESRNPDPKSGKFTTFSENLVDGAGESAVLGVF